MPEPDTGDLIGSPNIPDTVPTEVEDPDDPSWVDPAPDVAEADEDDQDGPVAEPEQEVA